SSSPLVVTSATLTYQDLRGLTRSFSAPVPISSAKVHLTSAEVNFRPSCHFTSCRNRKVSSVPSSFQNQLVARSGTIDSALFCGTSCLNTTRLLKTPDIGRLTAWVDSSSSDMLAGLSKWPTRRMPPSFCASAGQATHNTNDNAVAVARSR